MDCIKIDFEVLESKNTKKIMVGDTSVWDYASELPAYLYVTPPGSSREVSFPFTKGSIFTMNSNNLNSCETTCGAIEYVDLSDGIYKIKLQSGYEGIFKEKYYLKTDRLHKEISKKIVRKSDKNDERFKKVLVDIWYLIEVSKAYITEGDVPNSNKYYNEALEKFKCL